MYEGIEGCNLRVAGANASGDAKRGDMHHTHNGRPGGRGEGPRRGPRCRAKKRGTKYATGRQ